MKFLTIETDGQKEINELKGYFNDGKTTSYVFVHMDGCGHCEAMMNDWAKLEKTFKDYDDNLIIAKVNSKLQEKDNFDDVFTGINAYPSINYIKNNKIVESYNGDRTAASLETWINSKMAKQSGGGGKRAKKNKSKAKKTKKAKKTNKAKKTKSNKRRKTKKTNKR